MELAGIVKRWERRDTGVVGKNSDVFCCVRILRWVSSKGSLRSIEFVRCGQCLCVVDFPVGIRADEDGPAKLQGCWKDAWDGNGVFFKHVECFLEFRTAWVVGVNLEGRRLVREGFLDLGDREGSRGQAVGFAVSFWSLFAVSESL